MSTAQKKIRLSKRIADLGYCSRREAEEWITSGYVRVNGQLIDVLGSKVSEEDEIQISRLAEIKKSKEKTFVLYKPVGYVSHLAEDKEYPAAAELLVQENAYDEDQKILRKDFFGLAPAGRLDIDSKGLMILTQDGRVAKAIIGENSKIDKEYVVKVSRELTLEEIKEMRKLYMDGKKLKDFYIKKIRSELYEMALLEGKNRQIRRMFEAFDIQVLSLKRVRIGPIVLGDMQEGEWRILDPDEINDVISYTYD